MGADDRAFPMSGPNWRRVACRLALALAFVMSLLGLNLPSVASAQGAANTTVVPRSAPDAQAAVVAGESGTAQGRVTLLALLTDDGQKIDQGLIWRVFQDGGETSGKSRLVATHRDSSPELRLAPGLYVVNAAFGRANLTRKITVKPGAAVVEKFVLNAGGLKVEAVVENGERLPVGSVLYDILSDERDQFGNRTRIMTGARPGLIIRLNAGLYHVVSTYGDANAMVRADVTVEAGKLTSATVTHAAARVTFKLVPRAGGHALADTQWVLQTPAGEPVKESAGALPTHILAPGTYAVIAKSGDQSFRRDFVVAAGDVVEVEVVME